MKITAKDVLKLVEEEQKFTAKDVALTTAWFNKKDEISAKRAALDKQITALEKKAGTIHIGKDSPYHSEYQSLRAKQDGLHDEWQKFLNDHKAEVEKDRAAKKSQAGKS